MKHFTTDVFVSDVEEDIIKEWYLGYEPNKYDVIPIDYWNMP